MADTQAFEVAVAQVIEDSERLHKVVNGSGLESVVTEDGSQIPSVRKALLDNVYFKTPPLPWTPGTSVTVFNQLYAYTNAGSVQWWYAPGASISTPVSMPANPNTSANWRLYVDSNVMATLYAKLESPIFTGNPQAPTPNITSNSTTIATTEFVVTAIQNALSEAGSGTVTYSNVISTDLITANDLTVNGTTTINGPFDASNQDGRFANLILTKEASKLSFEWSDANNPSFTKTAISPYNVVTHRLATDLIVNGKANPDATVISFTGNGNNQMDYLKVVGNSERSVTDPRLEVVGLTKLENLQVTGQISGISFGIDGTDIKPNSVAVSKQLTVGTDITVTGKADIGGPLTTNELVATGTSAFEVVTVSESITIAADAVTSLLGDLTVAGDVSLGGASGTTRVNNLIVQGTVSGINFDLSDQDVIMNSILVKGQSTLSGGVLVSGDSTLASQDTETGDWSGTTVVNDLTIHGKITGLPAPDLTGQDLSVANLTVSGGLSVGGNTSLKAVKADKLTLSVVQANSGTSFAPDGASNIYYVTATDNFTLQAIPVVAGEACSYMIYIEQDVTGSRSITFDAAYNRLNDSEINGAAGSVTIIQVVYCGVGSTLDLTILPRS